MKDIRQALEEKRQEVLMLREKLATLRQAEDDLKVLERAYELITGKGGDESNRISTSNLDGSIEISNADAVEQILKKAGHPMHINELYKLITREYRKKTKKSAVLATITRYMNTGRRFIRPKPGTFGLKEWENKNIKEEMPKEQPPV